MNAGTKATAHVHPDVSLTFEPPVSRSNDFVDLRAELDCIVVFSACPQDIVPVNGIDRKPTGFDFPVPGL